MFNNVTRPDYIAPQKVGAFEALCAVVGHNVDIARHRHLLFRLRAAHRRAGIEATEEMMNVLRTTADWHGPLADNGHATVTLKSGGGRLSVAAIVRIDPGPHEVPISWLGVRRTDVLANVAARDS